MSAAPYELIQAAYNVACAPSTSAYGRTTSIQHVVPRSALVRLLEALAELENLTDGSRAELAERLAAVKAAELAAPHATRYAVGS